MQRYYKRNKSNNAQTAFNAFLRLKKSTRKISTYNRYVSIYNLYIAQYIDNIDNIDDITICNIIDNAKSKNLSNSTIQSIYQLMHNYLQYLYLKRLIDVNYCDFVDRPRRGKKDYNILSQSNIKLMLKYLYNNKNKINCYNMYIAVKVAIETGIRRGELIGLQWEDLDINNKTISIINNIVLVNGHTVLTTPKTAKSQRLISISDTLLQDLINYKKTQIQQQLKAGQAYKIQKYNNISYDNILKWADGTAVHPEYLTKTLKKICLKLNIPAVRWHDLRHTNATLLYRQGIDYKVIQARLGHQDIQTTLNIYTHISQQDQTNAVNATKKITAF